MIASNTGPLIALAKGDCLAVLQALYTQVLIPPMVYRELLAKVGPDAERLEKAFATFVQGVERPKNLATVEAVTLALDPGEREAVALAYQHQLLLVIDDRLGREAARHLGLAVTGTVGVLLVAKQKQLLPAVRLVLEKMQQAGCWFADELIDLAAKMAGES